jgi:hypothetical protein
LGNAGAAVVADYDDGDRGGGGLELLFESVENGVARAEFVVLLDGRTAAVAWEVGGKYRGIFWE